MRAAGPGADHSCRSRPPGSKARPRPRTAGTSSAARRCPHPRWRPRAAPAPFRRSGSSRDHRERSPGALGRSIASLALRAAPVRGPCRISGRSRVGPRGPRGALGTCTSRPPVQTIARVTRRMVTLSVAATQRPHRHCRASGLRRDEVRTGVACGSPARLASRLAASQPRLPKDAAIQMAAESVAIVAAVTSAASVVRGRGGASMSPIAVAP